MNGLIIMLNFSIIGFAMASAWLWWASSRRRVGRVSRREELDAADINCLVVAVNRAQMLNTRAALTTACAGALAAIRLALDLA